MKVVSKVRAEVSCIQYALQNKATYVKEVRLNCGTFTMRIVCIVDPNLKSFQYAIATVC